MRIPSNAQKQAIMHLSGPAVVTAGPGSGKTFVIVSRILYLIQNYHIPPDNILVITYTKAAAMEMKERYEKANTASSAGVHFGTFHSICYNILRRSGVSGAGSLIKESDKRKLLQIILANHGLSSKSSYDAVSNLINHISRVKNLTSDKSGRIPENGSLAIFTEPELQMLQKDYDRYLREQGLVDFEDMINETFRLLSGNPGILTGYRRLFRYILADEFQDINPPQYELLKLLAGTDNNLFVVGDDDQAIYGFRGAAPGIMRGFLTDFPMAKQIMLTENYRCGAEIVKLSADMISRNKERFPKEFISMKKEGNAAFFCFDTRKEEERKLVDMLLSTDKRQLFDTAVIVRTNAEAVQYAGLLREYGIPVKGQYVREDDIYHGFIMEDVSAFLAYLYEGGKRRDFIRFMNKPDRFLTREALPGEKVERAQMESYYRQNPAMRREIDTIFRQLSIAERLQPLLAVSFFRKTWGYDRYLRQRAKDYREFQRFVNLADNVQACFKEFKPRAGIRDFIKQKADKAGNPMPSTELQEGVNILTMHGSKGLEFERVFLPDVNEGIIPGKNVITESAIEEERRLLYVAMTRAKEELNIYCTKERGRKPSRYLEGLVQCQSHVSCQVNNPAAG